jgi:hypothetical protein
MQTGWHLVAGHYTSLEGYAGLTDADLFGDFENRQPPSPITLPIPITLLSFWITTPKNVFGRPAAAASALFWLSPAETLKRR